MKGFNPAFAVIRIDPIAGRALAAESDYDRALAVSDSVNMIRVYWSMEDADAEVARLNALNSDKGYAYFRHYVRIQAEEKRTARDD